MPGTITIGSCSLDRPEVRRYTRARPLTPADRNGWISWNLDSFDRASASIAAVSMCGLAALLIAVAPT
jgi:hypothetical protein